MGREVLDSTLFREGGSDGLTNIRSLSFSLSPSPALFLVSSILQSDDMVTPHCSLRPMPRAREDRNELQTEPPPQNDASYTSTPFPARSHSYPLRFCRSPPSHPRLPLV